MRRNGNVLRQSLTSASCLTLAILLSSTAVQAQRTASLPWLVLNGEKNRSDVTTVERYGLNRDDLEWIRTLPGIDHIIPVRYVTVQAQRLAEFETLRVVGATPSLLELPGARVQQGRFLTDSDLKKLQNVCVLTETAASRLFGSEQPIGQHVKLIGHYYTVVGVVSVTSERKSAVARELDVYVPLSTMRTRFGDLNISSERGTFRARHYELSEIWLQSAPNNFGLQRQIDRGLRLRARQDGISHRVWKSN